MTPASADRPIQPRLGSEGWKEISEGVFERQLGPNKVEHLGISCSTSDTNSSCPAVQCTAALNPPS